MHIVVVGGGFGGVKAALELARDKRLTVTLISDKDHFLYYPTLYATATGGAHEESVVKLSQIFAGTSVKVCCDTITGYDPVRKILRGKRSYHYDTVIFALGVVTSYFGIKGLQTYSYSIKSYDEVRRFKNHLHNELIEDRHMDKHYIVAGAGPTGVELAASLASYLHQIAQRHRVAHSRVTIDLVEAAPRILPRMSQRASTLITTRLRSLRVSVLTSRRVEAEDDDEIIINGRSIPTETVVWTSGVSNHPFFSAHSSHFRLAKNGRVEVDAHLMAHPSCYVIGDNANTPYTGMAQTALRDGVYVARDIIATVHRRPRRHYHAKKPITVVPVGARWALLEWHGLIITGWLGAALRRAADFIGYHDILPLKTAFLVWLSSRKQEEACHICHKSQSF